MGNSCYLFDWVSFTSRIHSIDNILDLLGFNDKAQIQFQELAGSHGGYAHRLYYDGISIHYGGTDNDGNDKGVWLEMSGQGCRVFESLGNGEYNRIFDEYFNCPEQTNITRIDVAFDDRDELIDFQRLCEDTKNEEFVSKWRSGSVTFGWPKEDQGNTIYWGSQKSDFFCRVYDKAKERGFIDVHWIRFELQLKDEKAVTYLKNSYEPKNVISIINHYIRFVNESYSDSNKWRWPMKDYWERFLVGAADVSLFAKPGTEYNIHNLRNVILSQYGGAIRTYVEIVGIDKLLKELREECIISNPKYKELLRKHKLGVLE